MRWLVGALLMALVLIGALLVERAPRAPTRRGPPPDSERSMAVSKAPHAKLAHSLRGHVVDRAANPIAGAVVRGRGAEATTGTNGAFDLGVDRDDMVLLEVRASGYVPIRRRVERGPVRIRMVRGAVIRGRVLDERGAPVSIASVEFTAPCRGSRRVDETGSFERTVTPSPRDIGIVVRAPGYAPRETSLPSGSSERIDIVVRRGVRVRARVVEASDRARPVAGATVRYGLVEGRTDENGTVVLEPVAPPRDGWPWHRFASVWSPDHVRATVELGPFVPHEDGWDAGVIAVERGCVARGVVRDAATGRPIEGATVESAAESPMILVTRSAPTDASGRYELRGLARLTRSLRARHADYPDPAWDWSNARRGEILFPRGVDEATVDVVIAPGAYFEGEVRDPSGRPVSGASVHTTWEQEVAAHTDEQGRFRIGPCVPDRIALYADHPDWAASSPTGLLDPEAREPIMLTLREGVRYRGRVVSQDGEPIVGAHIVPHLRVARVKLEPVPRRAVSDEAGRFQLEGVPRGSMQVHVFHGSSMRGGAEATPDDGAVHDLGDIRLWQHPFVEGVVLDQSGVPVVGATVRTQRWSSAIAQAPDKLAQAQTTTIRSVRTDVAGRFRLPSFPEGTARLVVQAPGFATERRVKPDTPLVIELRRSVPFRARLLDGSGEPLAGYSVRAWSEGIRHAGALTGWDGRFEMQGLVPDRAYTLRVSRGHVRLHAVEGVRVGAGERDLRVGDGRVLAGRVIDPAGRGVEGLVITIEPGRRTARTDAHGAFRVTQLIPGPLSVRVDAEAWIAPAPVTVMERRKSVEIRVMRPRVIAGSIEFPANATRTEADVVLRDRNGDLLMEQLTEARDDRFRVERVPEGRYTVHVNATWEVAPGRTRNHKATIKDVAAGTTDLVIRIPAE
ncbi:MAG: carboxypeptidase-like regulatory domain-containing protein [Planctomycetota bacterium]